MVSVSAEQHVSAPLLQASWETLTFVHWRVEPERIQALLPEELQVDVYDGSAWVSLTPFVMGNMRPLGLPVLPRGFSIPGLTKLPLLADVSSTPETNLRTYVRGPDGRDGLWFLTIDVGNAAVAAVIRAAVGAPYHRARMSAARDRGTVIYSGSRSGAREAYRLQVQPGDKIVPSDVDIWLTSRWRAYTRHLGRLLVTPVEHEPWPLRHSSLQSLEQNLTDSVGLYRLGEPELVHYSDGVQNVRLGRPALVG
jgi:uncharacterized protein YqjF (DUF2071 family)